ncbi:unnamed protein product [Arabis nemorensis]|uniref:Uridine kinase n=1 Tax=Arabis nemorensis TaxID=586526 RepID=A0A565BS92_9BRAS|nr:unnamed protein product [Arabis nemorensis]
MTQSAIDVPPKGGFSFDLCKRNDMLIQKGLKAPSFLKTGTTIVGLIFKDGVILGADTRATEGPIVADKNCEKIHYMAPNIYCCGAGTAADTEAVTDMVSSQLRLHRYQTGRDSRVITALTLLKKHLFSYQGHVSAALVLGGVDITGPHLHTIYPHGSTDILPFATMGSGSLAAMSVFEAKYKEGLTRDEGIKLVAEAICSGIFNDLGSGSNVDICVITKGNKEYLRNYMEPNPRTYVSSKGYSFTKKTEVLLTKITPLMERVEIVEELSNGGRDHFSISDNVSPSAPAPLKQPFVIGVAGGTASGKTTVCNMIMSQLHDQRVVLVNQDSFYHSLTPENLKKVHEYNFDHPDAFNTEVMLSCMEKLRSGKPVNIPSYDFKIHQSIESASPVNPADVIVLEGILVLNDPQVRHLMNMKIFVDTDADVRLSRRIQRDTVERGRNIQNVLEQYTKFVKPSFDEFIQPSMKYADIIIPRGGDNNVAIDLIVQHIRTKLCQHNLCKIYSNIFIISSTFQIKGMHTLIRDINTTKHDFVFYADRLIRLVVEHGLGHLPFTEKQITTPTGSVYTGVDFCKRLCSVSVIRSGESMENALRACCKGIKIGKILIHREGNDGRQLIYEKLPKDISSRHVFLLDPVLASGNSAMKAISLLLSKGVPESHIIFLNLIAAPQGIHALCKKYPMVKIVTSEIDASLNEDSRVIPGMGEFADRYFGTDNYKHTKVANLTLS